MLLTKSFLRKILHYISENRRFGSVTFCPTDPDPTGKDPQNNFGKLIDIASKYDSRFMKICNLETIISKRKMI